MDSEWAVEDSSVPCLPMPESWTLHASANILRKEGKEAAAIELEKLAQHASGSAGIPLMRRGSNTSCQEELVCATNLFLQTKKKMTRTLCLFFCQMYGLVSLAIIHTLCRAVQATASARSVLAPGNINRKNSFRAGSNPLKLEGGVDDWELHGLVR
jgi:hypothetical protein